MAACLYWSVVLCIYSSTLWLSRNVMIAVVEIFVASRRTNDLLAHIKFYIFSEYTRERRIPQTDNGQTDNFGRSETRSPTQRTLKQNYGTGKQVEDDCRNKKINSPAGMVMAAFTVGFALLFALVTNGEGVFGLSDDDDEERQPINNKKDIYEVEYEIGYALTLLGGSKIHQVVSPFQTLELYETPYFGKVLVLDECLQLTEKDAPNYNEMLAHIPMMQHANPQRVLVIGGGDGYVVHEVLKHKSVTVVDHVELDEAVIELSKTYFAWGVSSISSVANALWDDPRVNLTVTDGASFVRNTPSNYYDVIIQDSSDPFVVEDDGSITTLPSDVLYTSQHFAQLHRILTDDGVLTFQAETYNIPSSLEGIRKWRQLSLDAGFVRARYGTISIPSYSTGQIGFHVCEKQARDGFRQEVQRRFQTLASETLYYHPRMQERYEGIS